MPDSLLIQVHELYKNHDEMPYISPNRDLKAFLKNVQLGTESLVPKRNMIRTQEGLLPGAIILMWRISLGTYTTESWTPKYFEYDYGIHCISSLKMLLEQGYARQLSVIESLVHVPASFLKAILKAEGIKGYSKLNKKELVTAASQSLPEEKLIKWVDIRGYELTKQGQIILDHHPDIIRRHPKKG